MNEVKPTTVVVTSTKNVGLAIVLSVLFGPLGMLYATVLGGVIMIFVNLIVGFLTFGFGLILTWPIGIIWTVIAANSYNKKLTSGQRSY
jgi:hypothetical protein